MSKYLGIFVTEAGEHLEALGRELVELEKERNEAVIDSMFRHAHSVKGMAAAMGFDTIAVLAHRVEDLFHAVRSDPALLTGDLVDLLLSSSDTLAQHVRAASSGQPPAGADELLAQLSARLSALTGQSPKPTRVAHPPLPAQTEGSPSAEHRTGPGARDGESAQPMVAPPAASSSPTAGASSLATPRFAIKARIEASSQAPGVRAFLLHKRLCSLGTVSDLKPSIENLRSGRIPEGAISLVLETATAEPELKKVLTSIPEIELLSLKPVGADPDASKNLPKPEAFASKTPTQAPIRTVRVHTELLDYFQESVGELLLAAANLRELGKTLPLQSRGLLDQGVDRLQSRVKELHNRVMNARMTPLSVITDRFPRTCRDIARQRGREVDLVVTGADIELDRAIIDNLSDPLLHLLRNCIDHGIENPEERQKANKGRRGRILVGVRRSQERVVIDIEDDGRGMDAQKLKAAAEQRGLITAEVAARMSDREAFLLATLPGVSTARDVTEISGRGVGLDAVKRAVEQVGGTLSIDSQNGRGTRFTLSLPLTVAVVNLLLANVSGEVVGLPLGKVVGAAELDAEKLSSSQKNAFLSHGNSLIPVYELSRLLEWPAPRREGLRPYIVAESETGKVALAVDKLLGQEEVVLKVLPTPLNLIPGLSGVSILGSGRPIFILDVPRLVERELLSA